MSVDDTGTFLGDLDGNDLYRRFWA